MCPWTRYYLSPERDVVLALFGTRAGWHIGDHIAAGPGTGRGRALRILLLPELLPVADARRVTIHATAASPELAALYMAELPGLVDVGGGMFRGRRLRRPPATCARARRDRDQLGAVLHHPRHGRVQRGLTADPDASALVVAGVGVNVEGERVPELRPVSYHVPRHGPVIDLEPPVAGLEVRPRVLSCAAHEAVDAVSLLLTLLTGCSSPSMRSGGSARPRSSASVRRATDGWTIFG